MKESKSWEEIGKPIINWFKEHAVEIAKYGIELASAYLPKIWQKIITFWDNKTLAVIGPTACGKDSLIARLQGKPIPTLHINTGMAETIDSYRVHYECANGKVISFKANKSQNVGGEELHRDEDWKDLCQEADVIFYMLDAQKLSQQGSASLSRLKNDMRWLVEEMEGKNPRLVIILNKFDLLMTDKNDISESLKTVGPLLKDVKDAAQKSLGSRKDALKAVLPLSLTDNYLFNELFSPILRAATK